MQVTRLLLLSQEWDLRIQTQIRTEEGFCQDIQTGESVGVGLERLRPSSEMPNCVTTRKKDFTKSLADNSGYTVESFKEAFILVIKKNASILKIWMSGLKMTCKELGKQADTSVLIIDDEADNLQLIQKQQKQIN